MKRKTKQPVAVALKRNFMGDWMGTGMIGDPSQAKKNVLEVIEPNGR